jgi:hypothetical protein
MLDKKQATNIVKPTDVSINRTIKVLHSADLGEPSNKK